MASAPAQRPPLVLVPSARGDAASWYRAEVVAGGATAIEGLPLPPEPAPGPPARGLALAALAVGGTGPVVVDARGDRLDAAVDLLFWIRGLHPSGTLVAVREGEPPPALAALVDAVDPTPGGQGVAGAVAAGWPDPARQRDWRAWLRKSAGARRFATPVGGEARPLLPAAAEAKAAPAARPAPSPSWPPRAPDPLAAPVGFWWVQGPRADGTGPCPESGVAVSFLESAGARFELADPAAGVPGHASPTAAAVAARLSTDRTRPVVVRVSRQSASFAAGVLAAVRPTGPVLAVGPGAAHAEVRERVSAAGVPVAFVEGDPEPGLLHAARALAAGRTLAGVPGVRLGPGGALTPALPVAHLDQLPVATYAAWGLGRLGTASTRFGRGCYRRCRHCPDIAAAGAARARSGAHLAREVMFLVESYGVGDLRFEDLVLDADPAALGAAADALAALPWPVRWSGRVSVREALDDALLARLARSGCRALEIGLESGSDRDLDRLGKEFTAASAGALVDRVHGAGIAAWIGLSVGLPGADDEDLQRTRDFLLARRGRIAGVSRLGPTPLLQRSALGREPDPEGITLGGPGFRERWFDRRYNNHSFRRKRAQQWARWLRQEGIRVGGP